MTSENRYGIFGGTFDPIHNGHIKTVTGLIESCCLEQIFIVPTSVSPQKSEPRASAEQRLNMALLATDDIAELTVDDREIGGREPAYTIDTVSSFRQQYPDYQFCLILGLDAFLGFERWYRWQELLNMINFVVMKRPGWTLPEQLPDWWTSRNVKLSDMQSSQSGSKIALVDVEPHTVSATEIRYAVSNGIDASHLVEKSVWEYICSENLYTN